MTGLYKVLMDGCSLNGDFTWSLPRETSPDHYEPGDWHTVEGDLSLCNHGFHLTAEPYNWYKWCATVYEAEGRDFGESESSPHKIVCRSARLMRPVPDPAWLADTRQFIASLASISWMCPDGQPDPAWKLFTTRATAEAAEWAVARDVAWDAAWAMAWAMAEAAARAMARATAEAAARAAALMARCLVVSDVIDAPYLAHAQARMNVWRKGYALLCDVNGVLYVYERIQ